MDGNDSLASGFLDAVKKVYPPVGGSSNTPRDQSNFFHEVILSFLKGTLVRKK